MLNLAGQPLLTGLSGVTAEADPNGTGVFLRFAAEKAQARHVFALGEPGGIARFTCCHRYEPFWMKAAAGTRGGEVPEETQYLLAEREDGTCVLFVPLIDEPMRCCLRGTGENGLELIAETGDPATVASEVLGLFVAAGDNPYDLMPAAAQSVMARLKTGRLRHEKPLPDFVDRFGWCTWDAFYQEVSEEKVRGGLETFKAGGVIPRLLILDDGWQSEKKFPTNERRLTAFAANQKFPGDLGPMVRMAKEEYDVESFLVWHAIGGYWGGVDGESLPGYAVRSVARQYSPGIHHYYPEGIPWFGTAAGVVSPEHIYRFYQDYHRHLRRQGVDGVKVDNQASIEGLAQGFGGRVALMRAYHEALEGSVQTHFGGEVINCMSCSSEMLYSALNSTVTRTSTDFWPKKPESHGLHLYVNAQVSLWFGEFVHPDWDMFQSGHEMGTYHAAGRAVSGGPVYVSDKPGEQNFDLLKKLVLPDGSILRCPQPGLPTRDCLFHDPTREPVLLKIFNINSAAPAVVGVFNARYGAEGAETEPITGVVRPSDVEGIYGERFAVYAHFSGEMRVLERDEAWEITLPQLSCEVFTVAAIDEGFAAIGLVDKLNSGGTVMGDYLTDEGTYDVGLVGSGRFVAYSETRPAAVWNETVQDEREDVPFTYDERTKRLEVVLTQVDVSPILLRVHRPAEAVIEG